MHVDYLGVTLLHHAQRDNNASGPWPLNYNEPLLIMSSNVYNSLTILYFHDVTTPTYWEFFHASNTVIA